MVARRKALIVAIDDYGHPRNNLTSCINDSKAFEELLKSCYAFTPDSIHVLRDKQATPAAVNAELAWLCERAEPDDRLVFYYSGHGCQVPSDDPSQSGCIEEVLVLSGPAYYRDDRLSQHTQALPPGVFTAICDSCFSGGMEKDFQMMEEDIEWGKAKCYQPSGTDLSPGEQHSSPPRRSKPFGGAMTAAPAESHPTDESHDLQIQGLLLSACLEMEKASARTQHTRGLSAFTFGIIEALHELGPEAATRDVLENSRERLQRLGFRQTPLLKERLASDSVGARSFILLKPAARASSAPLSAGASARSPSAGGLSSSDRAARPSRTTPA